MATLYVIMTSSVKHFQYVECILGPFASTNCFEPINDVLSSDTFGCHIIMHAASPKSRGVTARIENVEINYAGQAFRLGRYPIHFHLLGDMEGSYIRGCSIHKTFNRAVNIHGTNNLLIEHNVVYDVRGGAFFLEDGIETGNSFKYNLAVFVQGSSSLFNDDIRPASFWITNPDNIVSHNHVAGGSHFGFWYQMLTNPKGPSFTENICPFKVQLGEFYNNSAHSLGWYGLWIFPKYTPTESGKCKSGRHVPAVFQRLTAWNCLRGAEWADCGDMQFLDFNLYNNKEVAIEAKRVRTSVGFSSKGPLIAGGLIVGHTNISESTQCTSKAIVLPSDDGLMIKDMVIANFDRDCDVFQFTRLPGKCTQYCSGWEYQTKDITLINSPNLCYFRWENEAEVGDIDGSITSHEGTKLVPWSNILPFPGCNKDLTYGQRSKVHTAVCSKNVTFVRMSFTFMKPNSLKDIYITVENSYGNFSSPWRQPKHSQPDGWMVLLPANNTYTLSFESVKNIVNMSYEAKYSGIQVCNK